MLCFGLSEIVDERLGSFRAEVMAIIGARTLTFREFLACGAPALHQERDAIVSRRWLADMVNVFKTSFCPEEANLRYPSRLLKDQAHDWWEDIDSE